MASRPRYRRGLLKDRAKIFKQSTVEIVGRSTGVSSGAVGPGMPVGACAVESCMSVGWLESTLGLQAWACFPQSPGSLVNDRETLNLKEKWWKRRQIRDIDCRDRRRARWWSYEYKREITIMLYIRDDRWSMIEPKGEMFAPNPVTVQVIEIGQGIVFSKLSSLMCLADFQLQLVILQVYFSRSLLKRNCNTIPPAHGYS